VPIAEVRFSSAFARNKIDPKKLLLGWLLARLWALQSVNCLELW
jgi:hypothetical protein